MTAPESTQGFALYVHIPFCERKCEYCDFASVAGKTREDDYVDALRTELETVALRTGRLSLDTVFFGGGTPSFIDPHQLGGVLEHVAALFDIRPGAEITLEANPSSTDTERAWVWRQAGFNRVSIGVQSLEPDCLAFLGRVHDAERARRAVGEVREAGFESVSCDLIYAIPGLDSDRWRRTLDAVVDLAPDHVSCYELTVEPQTPLHTAVRRGRVRPVAAEPALAQHWTAVDRLAEAGYAQYEISNFARPGHECRHNLVYWRNGHYLAAGVGAHGHLPAALADALGIAVAGAAAARYWHGRGVASYIEQASRGEIPIAGFEAVDATARESERLMLGLRLNEGIEVGGAVPAAALDALARDGLVTLSDRRARATRRGQELLDHVILRLAHALDGAGEERAPAALSSA